MHRKVLACSVLWILFCAAGEAQTADTNPATLPHFIRFDGAAPASGGASRSTTVGVTFSLYKLQTGGAPLWQEVQNVALDASGHYSVLLGATSKDGIPAELFTSNQARWLGVQVEQEAEPARILLVSVPYALKAGDAETVGGHPLSDFVMAQPSSTSTSSTTASTPATKSTTRLGPTPNTVINPTPSAIGTTNFVAKFDPSSNLINSSIFENGLVGINTSSPSAQLHVVAPGTGARTAIFAGNATQLNALLQISNTAPGGNNWDWGEMFEPGTLSIRNVSTAPFYNVMNMTATGKLGVGTVGPQSRFDVVGLGISGVDLARFAGNATQLNENVQFANTAPGGNAWEFGEMFLPGTLSIRNVSTAPFYNVMNMTASGKLGVGTVAPQSRFDVVGLGVSGTRLVRFAGNASTLNENVELVNTAAGGQTWDIGEMVLPGTLTIRNLTTPPFAAVLNLTATGNVGIGTATPANPLSVAGIVESTTGGFKFPDGSVQSTGAGAGTAARTRGIAFLAGCDTCSALADTDDQKAIYVNVIGAMTIQAVTCYSDTGTPIINIQRNTGIAAANILSPDLTCSTTGGTSSLVAGQSVLNVNDKLDFAMVTAGGAAHRVTVVIKAQLN